MTEMEINNNVDGIMTKANTLIEALPYIRSWYASDHCSWWWKRNQ